MWANQTQLEHEVNPSATANLDLILHRANLDLSLWIRLDLQSNQQELTQILIIRYKKTLDVHLAWATYVQHWSQQSYLYLIIYI